MSDPSPLEQAAAQMLSALLANGEWREGLAGHYNVVAFDGDNITGVAQAFGPHQRTFIAASPQLVRDLLAELQRLRLSLEDRTQELIEGKAASHEYIAHLLAANDAAESKLQDLHAALQGLARSLREEYATSGYRRLLYYAERLEEALVRPTEPQKEDNA